MRRRGDRLAGGSASIRLPGGRKTRLAAGGKLPLPDRTGGPLGKRVRIVPIRDGNRRTAWQAESGRSGGTSSRRWDAPASRRNGRDAWQARVHGPGGPPGRRIRLSEQGDRLAAGSFQEEQEGSPAWQAVAPSLADARGRAESTPLRHVVCERLRSWSPLRGRGLRLVPPQILKGGGTSLRTQEVRA